MNNSKELIEVWAGDFTFTEEPFGAIINRLDKVIEVEPKDLDKECEHILTTYESYLVPSVYKGGDI
jgi:hypothetical protein